MEETRRILGDEVALHLVGLVGLLRNQHEQMAARIVETINAGTQARGEVVYFDDEPEYGLTEEVGVMVHNGLDGQSGVVWMAAITESGDVRQGWL